MGGTWSKQVPWDQGFKYGADYDSWGYKPTGLTRPTQHSSVTEWMYPGAGLNKDKQSPEYPLGLVKSGLAYFGSFPGETGSLPIGPSEQAQDRFKQIVKQPNSDWFKEYDKLCTPYTFPNCDMSPWANSAPVFELWDGKTYHVMDMYSDAITDAYDKSYVNGGFDALQEVNENDTSTYDPCDNPSFFEKAVELAAAASAVYAAQKFLVPLVTSVDTGDAWLGPVVTVCAGGAAYNIAEAQLRGWGDNDAEYQRAANFVLVPAVLLSGRALGTYMFQSTTVDITQPQFQAIGTGVTFALFVPLRSSLAKALAATGFLSGYIVTLLNVIVTGASRFWCQLTTDNFDACEDKGEHPTGRRWDVLSIAGKLTDEACEREGWRRDDPRAEFVFRGLVTGPYLASAPSPYKGQHTSWWEKNFWNPLGEIYNTTWYQRENGPTADPYVEYMTVARGHDAITGWDGDTSGALDAANINLYACQNWDVLRNGAQTNSTAAARGLKSLFDDWVGNNEGEKRGTLVDAANNPNNIHKMRTIPGMKSAERGVNYQPVTLDPDCEDLISFVLAAKDIKTRADRARQMALSPECTTTEEQGWADANYQMYSWLASLSHVPDMQTIFEKSKTLFGTDENLSHSWYAIGASDHGKLPFAFWDRPLPYALEQAIHEYPPWPGLPYGNWTGADQPVWPITNFPSHEPFKPILFPGTEKGYEAVCNDMVHAIVSAPDITTRANLAANLMGDTEGNGSPCGGKYQEWAYPNQVMYQWLAKQTAVPSMEAIWAQSKIMFPTQNEPHLLADAWWAIGASDTASLPFQFWNRPLPEEMMMVLAAIPPPANGLPYGHWPVGDSPFPIQLPPEDHPLWPVDPMRPVWPGTTLNPINPKYSLWADTVASQTSFTSRQEVAGKYYLTYIEPFSNIPEIWHNWFLANMVTYQLIENAPNPVDWYKTWFTSSWWGSGAAPQDVSTDVLNQYLWAIRANKDAPYMQHYWKNALDVDPWMPSGPKPFGYPS